MPAQIPTLPMKFRGGLPSPQRWQILPRTQPQSGDARLLQVFWAISALLFTIVVMRGFGQPLGLGFGALLILASALLPNYLWVTRKVTGLPIFPLYALTATWIYALPLVSQHPVILLFSPAAQITAALSISGFLWLGTGAWYYTARRPAKQPAVCWMFNERGKEPILLVVLGVTFLMMLLISSGLITINASIFTALRAVLLAVHGLLAFILSYRLGQGQMSLPMRLAFYFLIGGSVLINMVSLLMVGAMSLLGLSAVAYTIGSQRLPWRVCLVAALMFGFLHNGKNIMREKYWRDEDFVAVSPLQYPAFLAEWAEDSWDVVRNGDPDDGSASLEQRASLMHMLLYFQGATPGYYPFLYGESYKSVPIQFVPRMFYPDKPRSLEGAYVVCIHYNMQTREDTDVISIDVGLINEAFANFGFVGMGVLAVVLGASFGAVANWARHIPIFSFRTLFAVSVLAGLLQAGTCASMYIATLYQNTVVLLIITVLFMRPTRFKPVTDTLL